jgi:hypothetical protein
VKFFKEIRDYQGSMKYKLHQRVITSAESELNDHYVVADHFKIQGLHVVVEGIFKPHLTSVMDYVYDHGARPTHYRLEDYEKQLIEKIRFVVDF